MPLPDSVDHDPARERFAGLEDRFGKLLAAASLLEDRPGSSGHDSQELPGGHLAFLAQIPADGHVHILVAVLCQDVDLSFRFRGGIFFQLLELLLKLRELRLVGLALLVVLVLVVPALDLFFEFLDGVLMVIESFCTKTACYRGS